MDSERPTRICPVSDTDARTQESVPDALTQTH